MIKLIKINTPNDLRDFMYLACSTPADVGVHTFYNQIADGKSVLGLMAIDYNEPVKIVCDDEIFMKKLTKWEVTEE